MPVFNKHRQNKRILSDAKKLLNYSKKVLNYRKHLMSTNTFVNIKNQANQLRLSLIKKDFQSVKTIILELEQLLRKNGGDISPVKILNDNIEVLLVASIIAISIRAFFIQTFQIPTNSMYPTYHGITTKLHQTPPKISKLKKIYNKLFHGTSTFCINADHTGNIEIPLFISREPNQEATGIVKFTVQSAHKILGIFPIKERVYQISIGDKVQEIHLPLSHSIDSAFLKKFGSGAISWQELYNKHPEKFRITSDTIFYKPGCSIKSGDNLINFDNICGDMLFVNKFSYHFRNPKVGEPIVFRTEKIKNIPGDPHYFIKRLIGQFNDQIQLKNGILIRNGNPISGINIFIYENNKINDYPGYIEAGSLSKENIIKVPYRSYFVLGDNSPDSGDSRYWGFVPQKEVTGKPLLIFYPLNRAGLCK